MEWIPSSNHFSGYILPAPPLGSSMILLLHRERNPERSACVLDERSRWIVHHNRHASGDGLAPNRRQSAEQLGGTDTPLQSLQLEPDRQHRLRSHSPKVVVTDMPLPRLSVPTTILLRAGCLRLLHKLFRALPVPESQLLLSNGRVVRRNLYSHVQE